MSGTAANNNGTKSARDRFFYSDDDGLLVAMRQGDYKYVFSEQRMEGTMGVWAEPFTTLRLQKIFNLFQDPFERADITSNTFWDWQINHVAPCTASWTRSSSSRRRSRNFRRARSRRASTRRTSSKARWTTSRRKQMLKESIDPERIRGGLNKMIEKQIQERAIPKP